MVTRIYTPFLPNPMLQKTVKGVLKEGEDSQTGRGEDNSEFQLSQFGQPTPQQAPASTDTMAGNDLNLTTTSNIVSANTITLNSLIADVQKTLDAMKADESTQQLVQSYLTVITHQGSQQQPSLTMVKQLLRATTELMDIYITKRLGEPSTVVLDWMNAALLQPIELKGTQAFSMQPLSVETLREGGLNQLLYSPSSQSKLMPTPFRPNLSGMSFSSNHTSAGMNPFQEAITVAGSSPFIPVAVSTGNPPANSVFHPSAPVNTLLSQAETFLAEDDIESVEGLLLQIQDTVDITSLAVSTEDQARFYHLQGEVAIRQYRVEDAMDAWQQALNLYQALMHDDVWLSRQATLRFQLGQLAHQQGEYKHALTDYHQAVVDLEVRGSRVPLSNKEQTLMADILNAKGNTLLQAKRYDEAKAIYHQALQIAQNLPITWPERESLLEGILANLKLATAL